MCIQVVRNVVKIVGDTAKLNDGRVVRIGLLRGVKVGDALEVYGDVALGKVEEAEENNNPISK